MSSPYSKITNDKVELVWNMNDVTTESGRLHMLETFVKLLSEEDNFLLAWYTVIGEEVSIGGISKNATVYAMTSLGIVKLDFLKYYWSMLKIIIRVLHPMSEDA
ncbi:hypothetical protein FQA39_LY06602 [Lamprigera yunnana]|nr:hypothetical protein FQA39_LY06602 [Lamprigera yunnana]